MQYTQDYDETYPYAYRTAVAGEICQFETGKVTFSDAVQPYVKSLQLFRCPSNRLSNVPATVVGTSPNVRYSYSAAITDTGFTQAGAFMMEPAVGSPTKLSQFTDTAETVMVGESQDVVAAPYGNIMMTPPGYATFNEIYPGSVHFDGGNWLFADGHVKYLLADKTAENNNYLWQRVKP